MGAASRGKLIWRLTVKEIKGLVALPAAVRPEFADGHDGQFVVQSGRHRRRVCLAVSSGGELVIPDWLRESITTDAGPDEEVSFYLSTRPLWLVESEQAETIAAIVSRHGRRAGATGDSSFTDPARLSPTLPNLARGSEVLDLAVAGEHR